MQNENRPLPLEQQPTDSGAPVDTARALWNDFALVAARESHDDPVAVKSALAGLVKIRREQLALLDGLIHEAHSEMAAPSAWAAREAAARLRCSASISLSDREDDLMLALAQASGVARILSDPAEASRLAEMCGRQKGEERQAFGMRLGSEPNCRLDLSTLGVLARALAIRGEPLAAMELSEPEPEGRSWRSAWSSGPVEELAASRSVLARLLREAEGGLFIADLLAAAVPKARSGNPAWAAAMPKTEEALGEPARSLFESTDAAAFAHELEGARRRLDAVAGPGASRVVERAWGRLRPLDPLDVDGDAALAALSGAALEGQEALGAFSLLAAKGLGLPLSGREQASQTKSAMRERFGLSDGGWRLLGRLPHGEGSAARCWAEVLGGHAETPRGVSAEDSKALSLLGAEQLASIKTDNPKSQEDVFYGKAVKKERERRLDAKLFSMLLAACATLGASPEAGEAVLRVAEKEREVLRWFFLTAPSGPRDAGLGADLLAAETQAFEQKSPGLLACWAGLALAGGPAAATDALMLARDWMRAAPRGAWLGLPAKPSWADVDRRQRAWHAEQQAAPLRGHGGLAWASRLPSFEGDGGWSAVALASSGALAEEGRSMRHCVATYAQRCAAGESCIFSLRKNGERIATLELTPTENDSWIPSQLYGPSNASIADPAARAFAAAIAAAYAEAQEPVREFSRAAPRGR